MSEYLWNEKNNTFTWLSSLYNPFNTFKESKGNDLITATYYTQVLRYKLHFL